MCQHKKIYFDYIDNFKSDLILYNMLNHSVYVADDIFIGETPRGKTPFDYQINGLTVGNLKSSQISTIEQKKSDPKKRLNLHLKNDSYHYADITKILDNSSIHFLNEFIATHKQSLLQIANNYEERGRQFFNFLYDLVLLFKTLPHLPDEFQVLLNDLNNKSDNLMHNGVVANIALLYKNSGCIVNLEPMNQGSKPDLMIDGKFVEIKTILTPKENSKESLESFAKKMEDINSKARKQVGKKGMVFFSPWSGIINSLFYVFYYEMKKEHIHNFNDCQVFTRIPPFQEGKSIFVVTTPQAFEDYYLVFDSDWIVDAMRLFARSRYLLLDKVSRMSYLKIQPSARVGFPIGTAGSTGISFKVD